MPAFIANYQKQATATSVKKAYNELNQIIQMARADYGDPSGWDYYGVDELDKWVQTYIEPYIKVVESGQCESSRQCFGINPIYHLYHNRGAVSGYMGGGYLIKKAGLDNFDSFVQTLKNMGIDDVLAVEQAAYDRYVK